MAFFFGDGPHAAAGNAGMALAERNRGYEIDAANRAASMAFQARDAADRNAYQFAALQRDAVQQQNALDREAEQSALSKYQFGIGRQDQQVERDWRKFQFDAGQKAQDKQFALQRDALELNKTNKSEEIDNAGNALAATLSELKPQFAAANTKFQEANYLVEAIKKNAAKDGLTYDPKRGEFSGQSPTLLNFNNRIRQAKVDLETAQQELKPIATDWITNERQARQFGFTVEPDGLRHVRQDRWFPLSVRPARNPMSFGTPAPAPAQQGATSYQVGRVYGGKRYLGGEPGNPASWQDLR